MIDLLFFQIFNFHTSASLAAVCHLFFAISCFQVHLCVLANICFKHLLKELKLLLIIILFFFLAIVNDCRFPNLPTFDFTSCCINYFSKELKVFLKVDLFLFQITKFHISTSLTDVMKKIFLVAINSYSCVCDVDISWKPIENKSERIEIFNFKKQDDLEKFNQMTSNDVLTKCFVSAKSFESQANRWFRELKNIIQRCFKKNRVSGSLKKSYLSKHFEKISDLRQKLTDKSITDQQKN